MSPPRHQPHHHTPPLGYAALTPLYDVVIALMTRERTWRDQLVRSLSPDENDHILDVGSGTGSLALAVHRRSPSSKYVGIDPDADAIDRARAKISRDGGRATFTQGYLAADTNVGGDSPTKIVSSLVLHQVPLREKQRILEIMHTVLKPGGSVHIADYGHQRSRLMKRLFRHTVQAIDGVSDTQPNADGIIPTLMRDAGFDDIEELHRFATMTGTISLYRGTKTSAWEKVTHEK